MVNIFKVKQYGKLLSLIAILAGIGSLVQIYQPAGDQSIFLITTLIAVTPVLLFEFWKEMKKPHVIMTKTEIIDFPHTAYDPVSKDHERFNNAICLRAYVKNIGFETAIDCECELWEHTLDRTYPSRWSIGGSNPVKRDLSPNEQQFVDLLWFHHREGHLTVPTAIESESDQGGQYTQSAPAGLNDLSNGNFQILIRASNMDQRTENLDVLNKQSMSLVDILMTEKKLNPYPRSLKDSGIYAISFLRGPEDWELQIPEHLNLDELDEMPQMRKLLFEDEYSRDFDESDVEIIKQSSE
jgi:hypothetical protein